MSDSPLLVEPMPVVADLRPYSPGRPATGIDLRLDSNEGSRPPAVLGTALAGIEPCQLASYPSARRLEGRIACSLGLQPEAVLVTAGADDALERAIRAVCGPGRCGVLTTPSFEMLRRYVLLTGAEAIEVPWFGGPFPVAEVCAASNGPAALVAVVSPNNPTGATISAHDFETLVRRMPESLVLLDHAYVEFADEDLTAAGLLHPNVLVFRTFSKAWSSAGLRVGYVAGDARVVSWLRSVGQPYPVSAPSLVAAEQLLDDTLSHRTGWVAAVRNRRGRLSALLAELGAEPQPSQANFVLARFTDAGRVRQGLASLGIGVRTFAGRAELDGWLRITVPGDDRAGERLEQGLRAVMRPEALLFDMDGVLADVTGSYRAAITATAEAYGVSLTAADISTAKAAGKAINDWELTQRLLNERGIKRPLDEVTRRFERLYQGDGATPGLRSSERLLMARDRLQALAHRLPLAVVTGRPRRDAERFLVEQGIADCFAAVIAMEDAAAKPDPAPVRQALKRLGVGSAWLLGDTPDDLVAARAAGVLPIGVVAPGEPEADSLWSAGAALVLSRAEQIAEVLP